MNNFPRQCKAADADKEYKKIGVIGKGGFGQVEVVRHLLTGALLARKNHHLLAATKANIGALKSILSVFKQPSKAKGERQERAKARTIREATNLQRFQGHDNVLQLFDFYSTDDGIGHIVTELCHGGPIDVLIRSKKFSNKDERFNKYAPALRQIANGIETIHALDVLHRDLKPNNILFRTPFVNSDVVIADFGLSRLIDQETLTRTGYFSQVYSSPEQMEDCHSVTKAADMYAFAVIATEVISGISAYSVLDDELELNQLKRKDLRLEALRSVGMTRIVSRMLEGFSEMRLAKALTKCVSANSEERLSINEVLPLLLTSER